MGRKWVRLATIVVVATTVLNCSEATEPRDTHVDIARRVWLANHPQAYTFEVATASSWLPKSGYFRVQVFKGQIVAASDSAGGAVANFTLTVEEIWDQLLAAQAKGQLNSAVFDERGIPIESDMGPWPVDGGVHYSVRNFAESR